MSTIQHELFDLIDLNSSQIQSLFCLENAFSPLLKSELHNKVSFVVCTIFMPVYLIVG